ncbi:hypothetical protein KJ359_012869 [Pestalotiopsis sp. 9143b]|nr:hypothetical protein KJ359_012869 [Pestalotiopsis sp. 9143b]
MESTTKQARTPHHRPRDDGDDDGEANDDELTLSASQFDARQHPMYELDKKRAKSAFKLKSRFEDIFEKFGKDFEGVGDEIDLRTGEVVVNNGHLQSLEDEDLDKSEDEEGEEYTPESEVKEKSKRFDARRRSQNGPAMLSNGWGHPPPSAPPSMFGSHPPLYPGSSGATDPAWQIPELQRPMLQNGLGSGLPFDHDYHSPFGAPGFGMSFSPWGAVGQPYRRMATAKEVGPRTEAASDAEEGGAPGAGTAGSDEEDALCSEIGNLPEAAARHRTKKSFDALSIPFAGLEEPAKDDEPTSNGKAYAKKSQSFRRRPGRPVRPKRQPRPKSGHVTLAEISSPKTTTDSVSSGPANNTTLPLRPMHESGNIDDNAATSADALAKRICTQDQAPSTDYSSDSQGRRSARVRKPVEHYSRISWALTRRSCWPQAGNQVTRVLTPPPEVDNRERLSPENAPGPENQQSTTVVVELASSTQAQNYEVVEDVTTSTPSVDIGTVEEEPETNATKQNFEVSTHSIPEFEENTSQPPTTAFSGALPNSGTDVAETWPTKQPSPLLEVDGSDMSESTLEPPLFGQEDPDDNIEGRAREAVEISQQEEVVADSDDDLHNERNPTPNLESGDEPDKSHEGDESIELGEPVDFDPSHPELASESLEGLVEAQELTTQASEAFIHEEDPNSADEPSLSASQSLPENQPSPSRRAIHDLEINPPPDLLQKSPSQSSRGRSGKRKRSAAPETTISRSPSQTVGRPPSRASQSTPQPSTPKKTRTLASLVPSGSDEEEDELSILSSSVPRTPSSNSLLRAAFVRGGSSTSTPLLNRRDGPALSTPRQYMRGSSRVGSPALPRLPATDTSALRFGLRRKESAAGLAQSSPLARTVLRRTPRQEKNSGNSLSTHADNTPSDGVGEWTPGGTARRCGEDGFVCDRDFCFTCCK